MGMIGVRPGTKMTEKPIRQKRERDNNQHRELCLLVGKWLRKTGSFTQPSCPYVAVELVTATQEQPDVFGWNYWSTVLIEVKISRSDFLADAKKFFRQHPNEGLGDYRYYCCPEGLIKQEELPDDWGLLYEKDGVIRLVKRAGYQQANHLAERTIYGSIARREGIKPQLFDYRKKEKML